MIRGALAVLLGVAVVGAGGAVAAPAETVEVYAAGSLRGVVSELAKQVEAAYSIEVKSSFGGSGSLRERIEKGESPDLFMSADVGSPRKLEAEGRAAVPAIPFARSTMCIVSERSAGVTASNLVERMLSKTVRLKTSTPVADPAGDYAWAIFDRIESLHPGAGAVLKEKAQATMNITATPAANQSMGAALFASKQIDMSITYCSGSANLVRELPELASLVVPPQLDPHPLYGMVILSNKPQAQKLALFLLSEKGQALLASQGLVPLTESGPTRP
jgi:molybdate transport system substrate-binding protein